MKFKDVAAVLQELDTTSSRNVITETLAEFFRNVEATEIREVCYLILGSLGPMFARVDFGVAEKMAIRSLARVSSQEIPVIQKLVKETGDMGEVAQQLKQRLVISDQRPEEDVSVKEIYEKLMALATANGEGSQDKKVEILARLIAEAAEPMEAKYIIRMVLGKMRLGFSDKTILDALAVMDGGSKQGRDVLELAYQVSPDIGMIAQLTKQHGIRKVPQLVHTQVGVPVIPQLAQRLKTAQEMIDKMDKVIVEPKFDGTRVQIHYKRGEKGEEVIKTYARSLEETSAMFPELSQAVTQIKAESVIIDCEAVGYDLKTGKMLPFQETITRKRKYGIEVTSKSIPIKFNCFDVLFLNGESLLSKPLFERRALLEQIIRPGNVLVVDQAIVTDSADTLRTFHKQQLGDGLEGAMVKKYDGEYQPGRTGWNWVKFKEVEDAQGKLRDTIDGVVMGYYRGKGKRSAFGIGAFLLGIRNEKAETWVSVAKIGTGLSDEQWREMRRQVDSHFSMDKPKQYTVADGLTPDVWAEPCIVVEIAADEITISPLHTSGYGLRFPRMVRFREDKLAEQVTTVKELALF